MASAGTGENFSGFESTPEEATVNRRPPCQNPSERANVSPPCLG